MIREDMRRRLEYLGYIGTLFYGLAVVAKFNGSSVMRNINENIGIGLIVFASLYFFKKLDFKKLDTVSKVYLILFILIPIFLTFSPLGIERGITYFRREYKFLPIFLCPIFLKSEERIKNFMLATTIGLFIYSLEVIFSYRLINWNFLRGYETIVNGVGYSAHGLAILSFLPLTLFFIAYKEKDKKVIVIASLTYILTITCVILAQRRGAWLAVIISLILYMGIIIDKKHLKKVGTILLIGIGILIVSPASNNIYYKRFVSIKDVKQASPSIRLVLWKASYEIYKEYPIFGIGDKKVAPYYIEYFQKNKENIIKETSPYIYSEAFKFGKIGLIHSLYFASLAMMGSLSLYFFLSLIYSFYKEIKLVLKLKKQRKKEFLYPLTAGAMNLSFLIVGLTELAWNETFIRTPFFIGIIIYISINKLIENSKNKEY